MRIDTGTIEKVAQLARLELADEEKDSLLEDVEKILTFMEKLKEVETSGVSPLVYMTDEQNVLREDIVVSDLNKLNALKNAPDEDGDFFRVAKVIK